MSNNFGSKGIIAIDELAHVVPIYFNLVNKLFVSFEEEHNLTSNLDNE
jgi:hypothetical protein